MDSRARSPYPQKLNPKHERVRSATIGIPPYSLSHKQAHTTHTHKQSALALNEWAHAYGYARTHAHTDTQKRTPRSQTDSRARSPRHAPQKNTHTHTNENENDNDDCEASARARQRWRATSQHENASIYNTGASRLPELHTLSFNSDDQKWESKDATVCGGKSFLSESCGTKYVRGCKGILPARQDAAGYERKA